MPSQKTLLRAYWHYTLKREMQALDWAEDSLMSAINIPKYANEYHEVEEYYIRRADRLNKLAKAIYRRL